MSQTNWQFPQRALPTSSHPRIKGSPVLHKAAPQSSVAICKLKHPLQSSEGVSVLSSVHTNTYRKKKPLSEEVADLRMYYTKKKLQFIKLFFHCHLSAVSINRCLQTCRWLHFSTLFRPLFRISWHLSKMLGGDILGCYLTLHMDG